MAELGEVAMRAKATRHHCLVIGDVKDVADHMETWFQNGAADGFNLLPAIVPGTLEDFCGLVVPELQARGLFRTEYEGNTLRDMMGLDHPTQQLDTQASRPDQLHPLPNRCG